MLLMLQFDVLKDNFVDLKNSDWENQSLFNVKFYPKCATEVLPNFADKLSIK